MMRYLASLQILFAFLSADLHSAIVIGIDNVHAATAANILGSGSAYSDFRNTITGEGHTIVLLTSFNSADLSGLDAIIIRQASTFGSLYSANEIAAIRDFVIAGNGLIAAGEAGGTSDSTVANWNSLAAPFGVAYNTTGSDGSGFTITGFLEHPVTNSISAIGVDFQRTLVSMTPPAIDLTVEGGSSDALAVVVGQNGGGNVVLLSDVSLWSTASDRPITFADNRQLLVNAIDFVTIPEPHSLLLVGIGFCMTNFRATRRRSCRNNPSSSVTLASHRFSRSS